MRCSTSAENRATGTNPPPSEPNQPHHGPRQPRRRLPLALRNELEHPDTHRRRRAAAFVGPTPDRWHDALAANNARRLGRLLASTPTEPTEPAEAKGLTRAAETTNPTATGQQPPPMASTLHILDAGWQSPYPQGRSHGHWVPSARASLAQLHSRRRWTPALQAELAQLATCALPLPQRQQLLTSALEVTADPTRASQGGRATCVAAALEIYVLWHAPVAYLGLVRGYAQARHQAQRWSSCQKSSIGLASNVFQLAMYKLVHNELAAGDRVANGAQGFTHPQIATLVSKLLGGGWRWRTGNDGFLVVASAWQEQLCDQLLTGPAVVSINDELTGHMVVLWALGEVAVWSTWEQLHQTPRDDFLASMDGWLVPGTPTQAGTTGTAETALGAAIRATMGPEADAGIWTEQLRALGHSPMVPRQFARDNRVRTRCKAWPNFAEQMNLSCEFTPVLAARFDLLDKLATCDADSAWWHVASQDITAWRASGVPDATIACQLARSLNAVGRATANMPPSTLRRFAIALRRCPTLGALRMHPNSVGSAALDAVATSATSGDLEYLEGVVDDVDAVKQDLARAARAARAARSRRRAQRRIALAALGAVAATLLARLITRMRRPLLFH